MIKKNLGLSDAQMQPNGYNSSYENSCILMNQMFYNYPHLFIHPQCKGTINDCEVATINEKSKNIHELKKDRGTFAMDYFDNMRYFFQKYSKNLQDQIITKPIVIDKIKYLWMHQSLD